jgi:hypothetical protein
MTAANRSPIAAVPDLDPEEIFKDVLTIPQLETALAVCAGRHARKLTFNGLMLEQSQCEQRLGPSGKRDFLNFSLGNRGLSQRAQSCNVLTAPAFQVAAVRAFRAAK